MKKALICINTLYIFLFVSGSIFAVGERTVSFGGQARWNIAESRTGVTEVRSVRPYPVLVLSSATGTSSSGYSAASGVLGNFSTLDESALDMSVSFDEREIGLFRDSIGNYRVRGSAGIEAVDRVFARAGMGAVLFGRSEASAGGSNSNPLIIEPSSRNALFASDSRIRDFTIEFWIYPLNMENGEQILSWVAARHIGRDYIVQRIHCSASGNKLRWVFENFFAATNGVSHMNLELSGRSVVIPKQWSHHLIRFDATTGMLEYFVDGASEAIGYATATGRESSEVYTPIVGSSGLFLLGEQYMGLMDEFKVHSVCAGRSSVQRYIPTGGRVETRPIDLGDSLSEVIRIDVSGGRTGLRGTSIFNEFRESRRDGRFSFSDSSQMNFFIRVSENPYLLNAARWQRFTPGQDIQGIHGRYVQIAVDFYPSADGETSPYLDELHIVYMPGEAPPPPRNVTVVAADGGVTLRWRHSSNANTAGYLVYYSSVRGELFGNDAALGASPIDVGAANEIFIEGLKNGSLYYFRVASYDLVPGTGSRSVGEFSAEVTARPLSGL